jgi:cyanophycinase
MSDTVAQRKVIEFKERPLRPGDPDLRPKGRLLVIGGHEDKKGDRIILRTLAERVGSGKLIVATPATEEPQESWEEYERVFRDLGVDNVHHLHVQERADAETVEAMALLEDATAVFFTGGDQLKITSLIGDTPVYSRIFEILLEGGTLAGTSAGASVMSETMLVGGGGDGSYRIGDRLELAPGFGFAKDVVIDQHFAERGRVSRLLAVVGLNPRIIGIGIDENTAIDFKPFDSFRVIGEGGVTVLDGRHVSHSNLTDARDGDAMSLFGVTMHLLSQGDTYELETRTPEPHDAEEVEDDMKDARVDTAADD